MTFLVTLTDVLKNLSKHNVLATLAFLDFDF